MLVPPDIEGAVVSRLLSLDEHVSTRVPNPRPAEFTRVLSQGGDRTNLIQAAPRVTVECWGATSVAAFERAQYAWSSLAAAEHSYLAPGVWVGRINLTVPVNFPDDATAFPRYQFVAQVTAALQEVTG